MSILNLYAKPAYKMRLIERIKWWFKRQKFIYQRATRGFCDYDVWEFNFYHADLVAEMLKYWAEHMYSFDGSMSQENWQATMLYIAECFEEWNKEYPQPAYEAYKASVKRVKNEDGSITVTAPDEALKAWREEEKEQYEYKLKRLKEGFTLLYKWYPSLWD